MAEYGGWVTQPPEKGRSWLKPIHLAKSELLRLSEELDDSTITPITLAYEAAKSCHGNFYTVISTMIGWGPLSWNAAASGSITWSKKS